MRALLMTSVLLSTTAIACPNLAGTYATCRAIHGHASGSTNMIVSQKVQSRVTTFKVSAKNNETQETESEVYIADGKTRTEVDADPDSGMTLRTSRTISCLGTTLNINMNATLDGQSVGSTAIKVYKNGKQLIVDSKNFDGEETVIEQEICE